MHQGLSQPQETPERPGALSLGRGDGRSLTVGDGSTRLMGVLNLTPDSFSDGGSYLLPPAALRRAEELMEQGADILDLGAESTRPGAQPLPPEEEWRRLGPVLTPLARARIQAVLSVDTFHAAVAARAADAGARLLNVPFPYVLMREAGGAGPLRDLLRRFDGVVLMHARGTPATMTALADYDAPVLDAVCRELRALGAELCDEDLLSRVIFDPGLGFAKRAGQSLALLGQIGALRARLGRPVLVGASRKSFLGQATGRPVEDRLAPSLGAAALAAWQGADLLRVHDVRETRAVLALCAAIDAAVHRAEVRGDAAAAEGA